MTDLQKFVRHAQKFGGYQAVFEEAVRSKLSMEELAALHLQMESMSRSHHEGQRKIVEHWKIPRRWRDQLIRKLLLSHKPSEVARMLGIGGGVVRAVQEAYEGAESLPIGGQQIAPEPTGTMTLRCAKGHFWERPARRGRPPKYCPDHAT